MTGVNQVLLQTGSTVTSIMGKISFVHYYAVTYNSCSNRSLIVHAFCTQHCVVQGCMRARSYVCVLDDVILVHNIIFRLMRFLLTFRCSSTTRRSNTN